ncbi:4-hydroxy-3-methylbut-2-enyl diphosphate reductase [Spiroplasma clarkii]|uniref:4-hydroxy-3-methylbut-2-enyl diphosphate reductase n=1 Tax=Spiroplasma clarkii TaxID=2139 RepID=A0A1Y0L191_9MOLU|nr:4-hydroxy-3-methylbut-2-enyl diphosphate reductase [Spiroplasma clarkii]ARU91459.1 4-hydroxy-3-methylbut-2-enyl diphosphate reductase [Spiroplasma clarkii]ATX70882.1 4-hydroxy-3-methylbut-2-enyl diphosphate reductase [Spiroplasma clarkii]
MKVIKVTPRGFCLGVVRSIKMAQNAVKQYPNQKIFMIGMLVHNKIIVNELKNLGIQVLDDWKKSRYDLVNSIPENSVVIFSAHGTDPKVVELALQRNLTCIDTKCEWVLETEVLIQEHLAKSYEIIFIGKTNHPETVALTSLDPQHIHLVTSLAEVALLNLTSAKIFITNQTTLSIIDTNLIYQAILKKYPQAVAKNDICQATLVRQQAVLDLNPEEIDLLYVVGDERSNNTLKLVELAQTKGIKAIRIDSKADIDVKQIYQLNTIAVTAGASTSSIIQNEVINYLQSL